MKAIALIQQFCDRPSPTQPVINSRIESSLLRTNADYNTQPGMNQIEIQAREILDSLVQHPFPDCIPISRNFAGLTTNPGIYAVRHRSTGLLYVGKAQDIKERFRGGHKALTWSWLEDYNHRDVAIAVQEIDYPQWLTLSSDLEAIILVWSKPPFNIRIPMRDEP